MRGSPSLPEPITITLEFDEFARLSVASMPFCFSNSRTTWLISLSKNGSGEGIRASFRTSLSHLGKSPAEEILIFLLPQRDKRFYTKKAEAKLLRPLKHLKP